VAVESAAGDLRGRCALVLGIRGPDPGLGEVELGAPAPLAEAAELAGSLAAYGYRDVLEAPGKPHGGIAAAADVQAWVDAALAESNWLPTATVAQPHPATPGLVIPGQTAHPASSDITQLPCGID
jgi:hypothetical protein